jgi:2-oxoisovalerate dehydrogenase E1 component
MESELQANPRALVFGEDVGAKGGVHGATLDLQSKFGEERVFDTSLSEEGIIGRAVGLALAGLLPIPEIQFRKYADPATEQLNDLGTIRWRTGGKFAAPIVVRIPVGYSKKIGDPWHSVTGEAIYAHSLGWRLAFPSNAADAAGLFRTALRGEDPTYLAMVYPSLAAAARFESRVEVLDLRTISPWDREGVLESVRKTGRCLVVQEDTWTASFASEILSTVASEVFLDLDAPIRRLTTPDVPIPYNAGLMKAVLPNTERIEVAIEELLAF